jgi:hypothetical protein
METNLHPAPSRAALPKDLLVLLLLAAAALLLGGRLLWMINRYSVNLLYWDQWDFYTPMFQRRPLWDYFTWQHGPHREGVGFILTKGVAEATRWNSHADGYCMLAQLLASVLCALRLKNRLVGGLSALDLAIPFAVLTPANWEHFLIAPNSSHSITPLLLILTYCLAWTIRSRAWRCGLVLLLNFFLIYTGFGVFMGLLTPVLLGADAYRAFRAGERAQAGVCLGALGVALLSMASFFLGYRFEPAVDCFEFPFHDPAAYLLFVSLMFSRFFCLVGPRSYPFGLLLAGSCVAVAAYHGARLVSAEQARRPLHGAIFTLAAFSLLFAANTAVGRVCTGLGSASASRYGTLMVPAILGIYLHLAQAASNTSGRALYAVFALLVVGGTALVPPSQMRAMEFYRVNKGRWAESYRRTLNVDAADAETGFAVYPLPEKTRLAAKLRFLKDHHLNLFSSER